MADAPTLEDLAGDLAGEVDVKEAAVAETAPEESSTEGTKPEVAEESKETPEESETEETPADESKDEVEPEPIEETEEEKPQGKAEERKQQLNTEIRDLVTQRRDLMNEVERLNAQAYAPQTTDEIMAETGQSQSEARITAMEQRQELSEYNTRVAEAQLVLESESARVFNDYPMFNPDSADYNPTVAAEAAQLLRDSLQYDQNTGQVIGSNISPYRLYTTIASANQISAVENQIKGQKSAEQMLSATEPQSSATPAKPKEDPFLAGLTKGYGDRIGT